MPSRPAYVVPDPAQAELTRRELLQAGWKVGGGLLALAAGWTTIEALRPLAATGGGATLTLAPPDAYADGAASYVREGRLWITRRGATLHALAQKCPHLGCAVPFCEASGRFECPCHGSIYDVEGTWIAGPAPRGMDRHPLQVVDGRVVVNTAILEEGAPLGTPSRAPGRDGRCAPAAEG
mgnify:CR=1 FL=1